MYELYYIVHIIGISVWIGSFAAFGFLLQALGRQTDTTDAIGPVIGRIRKWINRGVLPGAALVMLSGVMMILEYDHDALPFYLRFMEQAGSLVILLTIVFVSLYGRRISKRIAGLQEPGKPMVHLSRIYARFLLLSASLSTAVVIVVGLRIM